MKPEQRPESPNPSVLREDIDSGRTADKVDYPDPAVAPLGTDDEAAGTPVRPEQVRMARQAERSRGAIPGPASRPLWSLWPAFILGLILLLALAAVFFLS